jgi:DNA-binding transcriptional LysR family regulator
MAVEWNDLRVFLALERTGSLSGAARELGVDPSTVSRRLAHLEEALATKLAARTPEGLQLTEAGRATASAAADIEAQALTLEAVLSSGDQRVGGVVRLTTTDGLLPFLLRGLVDLRSQHPDLMLEVIATNAALDLKRREADCAVRMFRDTRDGLVARRLGSIGWSLYAGAAYLARHDAPRDARELAGHEVVAYEEASLMPGAVWLAQHLGGAHVVLRVNGPRAAMSAIGSGLGLGVLPCFIAAADPMLVRVTPEVLTATEAWWLVMPELAEVARVRVVCAHIVALFERERATFAG